MLNECWLCSNGIAKVDSIYGKGTGLIWLDDVVCDGTETSLDSCHIAEWGKHDCDHTEDAGVICSDDSTTTVTKTTEKPCKIISPFGMTD